MLDQILSALTQQALPKLMQEHGLTQQQAQASIASATGSVGQALGGNHGFSMETLLNLFSNSENSSQANALLGHLGNTMTSNLTGQAGLSPQQASSVQSTLLPMITNLLASQVGGQSGNLQGLLGSLMGGGGGGLGGIAHGMLGKLFQ